jgi:hypothetical protein
VATIHNDQPVIGVRLVSDGTVLHNNLPVIGIVDATGETFLDNQRVLGVDVLDADVAMHNDQPVMGAVLIADGRDLYNNQLVIPVEAVSGVLA